MILICRSNSFLNFYEKNTNSNFYTNLLERKIFKPNSKIALLEIFVGPVENDEIVYVYSNVTTTLQIADTSRRLLSIFNLEAKKAKVTHLKFANPIYFPLDSPDIQNIRLAFKNKSENFIAFEKSVETVAILHIQEHD